MSVRKLGTAALALLPFLIAAMFWRIYPAVLVDADTPRYLSNDPMRTATYPLFLDLFNGPALLAIQLGLFAAALSWLGVYSVRFLPWIVAAALVLGIALNPYLWELQVTIMSEALGTPIFVVLIGLVIGFAANGRRELMIVAALLCGIVTTIRPPCLPLIIGPAVAVLLAPALDMRFKLLALMLIAWVCPVIIERVYSRAVHGSEISSPLGRHAFMKAALIDAPAIPPVSKSLLDQRVARALNEDYAPVRQVIARAPDWQIRYILLTNYESCAAWGCGSEMLKGVGNTRPEIDQALFRAGIARLKHNPIGYLNLTGSEYLRMWLLHPRKHPDLAPAYNAFLAQNSPLPFQPLLGVEGQPTPPNEQSSLYRFNRVVFAGIGILAALLTVVAFIGRRQVRARVALPLLLGSEAILILCAFTAVGLPRYAMGIWPLTVAGILFALLALFDRRMAGMMGKIS